MDEAKRVMVQAWLFKAQRDLDSAQRLADKSAPLLDTAVYHCQQAAEKTIKAFLVCHDVRVPKTHDLADLLLEAAAFTSDYAALTGAAERLTQYATLFRYPGARLEPTQAEYEQAYQEASQFVSITLGLIPTEAHPAV
jgi:HEPN domain-containing protein